MKNIKNKVIWITGASSGIGEALVYEFNSQGAKIIASSRNLTKLKQLKNRCSHPDNCILKTFDLANTQNIQTITDSIIEEFGQIDILINNGGISQRALIAETSLEIDRKIMEINYFGTIALTKSVLPYMIKQKSGYILATSSIVGKFGFPLRSAYSASKHALHGFFETLRAENYKYNIKVSVIIPGRVQTNISVNALTKEGKTHGQMDAGQATGITTKKAVKQIISGMKSYKNEINVGSKELMMMHIRRFFPKLAYKMARNIKAT